MNNLFFILLIGFFSMSCHITDNKQEDTIFGKWKLIETYDDPGDGSGDWIVVSDDDSYTYQFNSDFTYIYNRNENNSNIMGTYKLKPDDNINDEKVYILTIKRDGFDTESKLSLHFDDEYLIIDGTPYGCDESCAEKFIRID